MDVQSELTNPRKERRGAMLALLAIVVLAAALRLPNLGYNSLNHGEAARLTMVSEGSVGDMRWFPPLLVPLNWALREVAGVNEFVIRLPHALLGIACVALLFLMVRRYFDTWSAICAASVAAVHPILIFWGSRMAKEFSLEALMTVVIFWSGISAYRKRNARSIFMFGVAAVFGMGLTYSAVLHIAAWLPVLFYGAWRSGQPKAVRRVGVMAASLVPFGIAWYVWLMGNPLRGEVVKCYGEWFDPWPASYTLAGLSRWLYKALYGSARLLTGMETVWPPLSWVIGMTAMISAATAVTVCWRRCRELCFATGILIAGTLVAGALKQWPVGAIHTITFGIPLACVFVGCGLRHMARRLGWNVATVLLVLGCIGLPAARAAKQAWISPVVLERTRPAFEHVLSNAKNGDGVFVYYGVRRAFTFYWPDLVAEAGLSIEELPTLLEPGNDRGDVDAFASRLRSFQQEHERVWLVMCHTYRDERRDWVARVERDFIIVDSYSVGDALVLRIDGSTEARVSSFVLKGRAGAVSK